MSELHSERVWLLMTRKLGGEASQEELKELDQLLARYPDMAFTYELLTAVEVKRDYNPVSDPAQDKVFQLVNEAEEGAIKEKMAKATGGLTLAVHPPAPATVTPVPPARSKGIRYLSSRARWAAAMITLVIGTAAAVYFLQRPFHPALHQNQVTTKNASRTSLTLPDGTLVWLNVNSQLHYADGFAEGNRLVKLEGEAYFEVAADAAHPFRVQTNMMDIQVLGTAFNVKAYPGDHQAAATLITGEIVVSLEGQGEKKISLSPKEKLTVWEYPSKTGDSTATVKYQVAALGEEGATEVLETAWMRNRLAFRQEPFGKLANQLERWYNVKIVFENDALKQQLFSGNFEKETVTEAMKALSMVIPFQYTQRGDTLFIKP
ncbi:FecR family protein [Chitinophaga defluvii]|uniref:FecR domain-containing protein n=1 Tax=Chitinophaga defluvii TaxID=3163343 RepID=A0ABV2T4T9_9BACT